VALSAPTQADHGSEADGSIAVVVLTHNRVHLLRKCVENVLLRTSDATREIVIWNNASTDTTADYLATLRDPRIRVVHSETNIGQNAYARAFRRTSSAYLVEVDDDVVDAPDAWDATLRDALRKLPAVGFLAADLKDDPHDVAAHHRYRVRPNAYVPVEVNGVKLLRGPVGGGCAMTPRDVYERAGGFRENKKQVFWLEDSAYIGDIHALGYEAAVLAELKVLHTGGPYYSETSKEKHEYWTAWARSRARREAVKRSLVRVPYVRRLNDRYGWFSLSESSSGPER
jgi:GT2 family glycosyltransferase